MSWGFKTCGFVLNGACVTRFGCQVTMLLDRLNHSTDELEQMKTAFAQQLSMHASEVQGLNERLHRVTHQFESAAATMRQVGHLSLAM